LGLDRDGGLKEKTKGGPRKKEILKKEKSRGTRREGPNPISLERGRKERTKKKNGHPKKDKVVPTSRKTSQDEKADQRGVT